MSTHADRLRLLAQSTNAFVESQLVQIADEIDGITAAPFVVPPMVDWLPMADLGASIAPVVEVITPAADAPFVPPPEIIVEVAPPVVEAVAPAVAEVVADAPVPEEPVAAPVADAPAEPIPDAPVA